MVNQESFYQRLFRSFHRNRRMKEVRPQTTGEALGLLKEHTGMSWEELSRNLGILPSTAAQMVRRSSKLPIPVCAACKRMAERYHLPVLEEWFNVLLRHSVMTRRRAKSDDRPEDRRYYNEIR